MGRGGAAGYAIGMKKPKKKHQDEQVDEAGEESFPASDAPSVNPGADEPPPKPNEPDEPPQDRPSRH